MRNGGRHCSASSPRVTSRPPPYPPHKGEGLAGVTAGDFFNGRDDPGVAGAAAEVAAKDLADFPLSRMRIAGEEIGERHQNARRAEAALQGVIVAECLLQGVELAVGRGERFHGAHLAPFRLHRKRQAGARGDAVDQHGAGAADAVLAADMGAGGPEPLAKEIAEQHARLGFGRELAAVERQRDARPFALVHAAHFCASAITSGARFLNRSRRIAADACKSSKPSSSCAHAATAPAGSLKIRRTSGRPAMPPTPRRAAPRLSTTAATAMMAKSPCRRATSRKATPCPAMTGNRTATISSSATRAVVSISF